VELGTDRYQLLGNGSPFEEAERRAGVEFDVGHQFPIEIFHHRGTEAQRKTKPKDMGKIPKLLRFFSVSLW
jgi:hypothetical protein